jgi:hypothetical protein
MIELAQQSVTNIEALLLCTAMCIAALSCLACGLALYGQWRSDCVIWEEDRYCDFLDVWSHMRQAGVPYGVRKVLAEQEFGPRRGTVFARRARIDTTLADMKLAVGCGVERLPGG